MGPKINASDLYRALPARSGTPMSPHPNTDPARTGFKDYLAALQSPTRSSNRLTDAASDRSRDSQSSVTSNRGRAQSSTREAVTRTGASKSENRVADTSTTPPKVDEPQSQTNEPVETNHTDEPVTEPVASGADTTTPSGNPYATMLFVVAESPTPPLSQGESNAASSYSSSMPNLTSHPSKEYDAATDIKPMSGAVRPLNASPPQASILAWQIKEAAQSWPSATPTVDSLVPVKPADRPDYTTAIQPQDEPIKVPVNGIRRDAQGAPPPHSDATAPTGSQAATDEESRVVSRYHSDRPSSAGDSFAERKLNVIEARDQEQRTRGEKSSQGTVSDGDGRSFGPSVRHVANESSGAIKSAHRLTLGEHNGFSVQSATGDAAAAGLARLLVEHDIELKTNLQDLSDESSLAPPDAARHHSGQTTLVRGVGQGSTAATVGELLTSQTLDEMPADVAERLLNKPLGQGRHQATLRLDPPELGQMRIDLRVNAQGMMMRVDVEHPAAAKLIESRLNDLREALASHGIRVERADVIVRSPETDSQGNTTDLTRQDRSDAGEAGRQGGGAQEHNGREASARHSQTEEAGLPPGGFDSPVELNRPNDDAWETYSPRRTRTPVNLVA